MEPNYMGANGRIDAKAVAWLFAKDHVFFDDGEITWDGRHHGIAGAQINGANMDEIPQFMDDPNMYFQAIGDVLLALEKDEELRVPREKIHPALHKAIREGDLTGLTLFNLQACGRAFFFMGDEEQSAKTSMLEMAGLQQLLDHPSAMENVEMVMVDPRLARGIPGFYKLVARMVEDMRAYNGKGGTRFVLLFANARNFDADQYLDDFEGEVEGAVVEPVHVEMCDFEAAADSEGAAAEAVVADDEAVAAETEEAVEAFEAVETVEDEDGEGDEGDGDGETSDRNSMLALLNLMVLTAGLGGVSYPQDILDELERAAEDETVDVEDLARRINDFTPGEQAADLSNATFNEGKVAQGRRFKVAVPDGWTVLKDYAEESFLGERIRPFVLIEGELDDPNSVSMRDRIIYSAIGGDVEDEGIRDTLSHDCIQWLIHFGNAYDRSETEGLAALKPVIVWDKEAEAVNTKCFITQHAKKEGANGLEFDIHPFSSENNDYLRCVFSGSAEADVETARAFVMRLAQSIELDNPYILASRQTVRRATGEKVPVSEITEALNDLFSGYDNTRQRVFTVSQYKYVATLDGNDFDEDACTLAGAQGIADFCNRAIPDFELALDAYDAQARLGASVSDLDALLNALQQVDKHVFPTSEIFGSDGAAAVDKAGIFEAPERLKTLRERIRYAKQHPGKPTELQ